MSAGGRGGRVVLGGFTAAVYAFLYAPVVILVIYSFNRARRTAVWEGATLDWYRKLLEDSQLHEAALNSLIVAGFTTVITVVLGTLVGVALGRRAFRGRALTSGLLYLPMVIPEIVLGVGLVVFFGIARVELSLATVVVAHVVFCLSYVAIVVQARMAGLDPTLEEAAADLGASPVRVFFRVTLPRLLPGILAGGLLSLTLSLDDFLVTSFVAGVGSTTLPLRIYSMLKVGVTPEVNAVSTLLLLFTVVTTTGAQLLLQGLARREASDSRNKEEGR